MINPTTAIASALLAAAVSTAAASENDLHWTSQAGTVSTSSIPTFRDGKLYACVIEFATLYRVPEGVTRAGIHESAFL